MIETNKVHQGDCLAILSQIPSESVDMVFADPPFNLKKKYNSYADQLGLEDYLEWCNSWLTELVRVTKPTGSIFVHNIPKWLTYYSAHLNKIAEFRNWIAWDAMGSPMGKGLLPNHYGILYYVKNRKLATYYDIRYPHFRSRKNGYLIKDYGGKKSLLHPFGPLVSDVWNDIHRIRHNKRRDKHPCQLPIPLLERLILMTTDEGDVILDPFSGTGTSLVAAKRLGRQYIGIELDSNYVDIAQSHLEDIHAQSRIHDVWLSIYLNRIVTLRDKDWATLKPHFVIPSPPEAIDHQPIRYKYGSLVNIEYETEPVMNTPSSTTQLSLDL